MTKVRLYAHRGAAVERPENTLPSFELALELGATALELDVHATRDGVVVVSHDPDGRRMANVAKRFSDADWSEVATWDVGWGFVSENGDRPFAGQSIRVPRLDDVLDAFPNVDLNIDLKVPIADPVVALLRARQAESRVCLASFDRSTIEAARRLGYGGPTGLARAEVMQLLAVPAFLALGPLALRGKAAQLPISLARPWVVARCKRLGLRVDFWTVNEPRLAQTIIDLGADGIMTDDTRRIAPIVQSANARGTTRSAS